jgi:hypothetical protein
MRRVGAAVWATALLAALAVIGLGSPTAAQDASAGSGAVEYPIDPVPADCQVEPRSTDELIALWLGPDGSSAAAPLSEEASTTVTIPLGTPADEATVGGVVAALRETYACFETGDFRRTTALFTDDLTRTFGPGPDATEEDVRAFLAWPEPATEAEASQIIAIADVMVLADGRVGVFVVDRSADEGTHVAYVVFERAGDRWLADETIEFGGVEDVEE